MKPLSLIFLVFLLASGPLKAQLRPITLSQRVEKSSVIFEGRVTDQKASWDAERRHIYTINTVTVFKVFKGQLNSSTVEVITIGGTVGNEREDVSYGLKLQEGDVGVFTCNPTTLFANSSGRQQFRAYSEIQGFIEYDLASGSAKDVFNRYESVSRNVYPILQKLTDREFKTVKKADFIIK